MRTTRAMRTGERLPLFEGSISSLGVIGNITPRTNTWADPSGRVV